MRTLFILATSLLACAQSVAADFDWSTIFKEGLVNAEGKPVAASTLKGKVVAVYFSAEWCGPCAAVRRVIHQVVADLPQVTHVEIDMDENPGAARRLSVLSLPTTFIFDAEGRGLYRSTGVPKAADLKAALEPLLT